MKILIEAHTGVCQSSVGGIQTRIKAYIDELKKQGHTVKLFNKWEDKIIDYDVLHIFKLSHESLSTILIAKSNGIPVVLSAIESTENKKHKKIVFYVNWFLYNNFKILIHYSCGIKMEIFNLVDRIITETKSEHDFIKDVYKVPENKIFVIPNGASKRFKDADPKLFMKEYRLDREYVLHVGRFDENKNQLNIIKAMQNTDIPIVFVGGTASGDQSYLEKCKGVAGDNMVFTGWIPYDSPLLQSAYAGAKTFVLPSYYETFGMSLVEAGIAGVNIVCSNQLPILHYGISGFCKLINPSDIEDIRKSLIESYFEPKNGYESQFFEERFSWERVVSEHLKLYKELLK